MAVYRLKIAKLKSEYRIMALLATYKCIRILAFGADSDETLLVFVSGSQCDGKTVLTFNWACFMANAARNAHTHTHTHKRTVGHTSNATVDKDCLQNSNNHTILWARVCVCFLSFLIACNFVCCFICIHRHTAQKLNFEQLYVFFRRTCLFSASHPGYFGGEVALCNWAARITFDLIPHSHSMHTLCACK